MTREISNQELLAWDKDRFPISICTVLKNNAGYRVSFYENFAPTTPPAPLPTPKPPEPPKPATGQPEAVMVTCFDCSNVHPDNEPCNICETMLRIQKLARQNRRNYALEKRFGRNAAPLQSVTN